MLDKNEVEMPPVAVVADLFKQAFQVIFVLGWLWLRTGNYWKRMDDYDLRAKITRLIDDAIGAPAAHPTFVGYVVQAIIDRSWVDVGDAYPPFKLDGSLLHHDLLPSGNGVLDLETRTLMPHDENLFSLATASFDYNPESRCPRTMEWLRWFCCNDKTLVEQNLEWDYYCLATNSMQLQRYGMWIGIGNNSKQTKFFLSAALCGNDISTVSLDEFADRFVVADMVGRHIVQDPDISETTTKKIESRLKKYCDGSWVRSERKYKQGANVVLKSRIMLGANKMPRLGGTDGDWRRPLLFPCDAKVQNRIANFEQTLIDELPGYLNAVLDAGDRLRDRGDFLESPRSLVLIEDYRCDFDSARDYCKRCVVLNKNAFTPSEDIFSTYDRWTAWGNRQPVSDPRFWRTFRDFFADAIASHVIYPSKKTLEREEVVYRGEKSITRRVKKDVRGWKGIVCNDNCYAGVEESEIVDEIAVAPAPLAIAAPVPSPAPSVKKEGIPVSNDQLVAGIDALVDLVDVDMKTMTEAEKEAHLKQVDDLCKELKTMEKEAKAAEAKGDESRSTVG